MLMVRRVQAALDRHWFAPAPLSELAFVRIVAFASQTFIFLWYPVTLRDQLLQIAGASDLYDPLPILRVMLAPFGELGETPPTPAFLTGVFAVAFGAGVLATIGLFARVSMVVAVAAAALLQAHHYSYGEFHHAEALMVIALGALALGPSAAVWSVDSVVRARRTGRPSPKVSIFARWPLRLMQWMIVLSYFSAAWAKLSNGGLAWFNGHTMTFHYVAIAIEKGREAPAYMATLPPVLHVAPSFAAWLVEATFFGAILAPRWVWLFVLAGTTLHVAVFATMGITFLQNLVLYSAFVESLRMQSPRISALFAADRRGSPVAARVTQVQSPPSRP